VGEDPRGSGGTYYLPDYFLDVGQLVLALRSWEEAAGYLHKDIFCWFTRICSLVLQEILHDQPGEVVTENPMQGCSKEPFPATVRHLIVNVIK
jgi:hypothetical protein